MNRCFTTFTENGHLSLKMRTGYRRINEYDKDKGSRSPSARPLSQQSELMLDNTPHITGDTHNDEAQPDQIARTSHKLPVRTCTHTENDRHSC